MVYNTRNYWVFGLHPSSGILKNTREHNVSETGFVSVLRWGERHLLCWVRYKELTSITGQTMSESESALFEPWLLLEDSARLHLVFTSLDFETIILLQSRVVSVESNPPTWRTRSLYLFPPVTGRTSYTPRHQVPFSSPSTTRRAKVGVF
jgi:hypothetical protein